MEDRMWDELKGLGGFMFFIGCILTWVSFLVPHINPTWISNPYEVWQWGILLVGAGIGVVVFAFIAGAISGIHVGRRPTYHDFSGIKKVDSKTRRIAKLIVVGIVITVIAWALVAYGPGIWQAITGGRSENEPIWTYQTEAGTFPAVQVVISPDGKYVAVTGGYEVYLLSSDGSPLWEYHTSGYTGQPQISSDGSYLVTTTEYERKVLAFSRENSTPVWTFQAEGSASPAISSDGGNIAIGCWGEDLYYLSTADNSPVWTHATGDYPTISADGDTVAAFGMFEELRLFDNSGTVLFEVLSGSPNCGWSRAALSADGKYVVAVSYATGEIYLFSWDNTNPLWIFNPGLTVWDLAISDNGDYIAVAAGSKVFLLPRTSSTPIWSAGVGSMPTLTMSADGSYIVVGDQEKLSLYHRSSSTPLWTYTVMKEVSGYSYIGASFVSVDISSDGSLIVGGGSDGKIYAFNRD